MTDSSSDKEFNWFEGSSSSSSKEEEAYDNEAEEVEVQCECQNEREIKTYAKEAVGSSDDNLSQYVNSNDENKINFSKFVEERDIKYPKLQLGMTACISIAWYKLLSDKKLNGPSLLWKKYDNKTIKSTCIGNKYTNKISDDLDWRVKAMKKEIRGDWMVEVSRM
ncbi:hypothetical protein U1Q18_017642 [Sarracenia purpurea var. burkii]